MERCRKSVFNNRFPFWPRRRALKKRLSDYVVKLITSIDHWINQVVLMVATHHLSSISWVSGRRVTGAACRDKMSTGHNSPKPPPPPTSFQTPALQLSYSDQSLAQKSFNTNTHTHNFSSSISFDCFPSNFPQPAHFSSDLPFTLIFVDFRLLFQLITIKKPRDLIAIQKKFRMIPDRKEARRNDWVEKQYNINLVKISLKSNRSKHFTLLSKVTSTLQCWVNCGRSAVPLECLNSWPQISTHRDWAPYLKYAEGPKGATTKRWRSWNSWINVLYFMEKTGWGKNCNQIKRTEIIIEYWREFCCKPFNHSI